MKFSVYILQSSSTGRFYCGYTSDIDRRIRQHNDSDYHGSKTTKRFQGPWILVWAEQFKLRTNAMKRERQIKKRGNKRFLTDSHVKTAH